MTGRRNHLLIALGALLMVAPAAGVFGEQPLPKVPPEYADKHMPAGWWMDPKVIAAGKEIFMKGVPDPDDGGKIQKCAKCHGEDGNPKLRGARDFRVASKINRFTDSYFFWRVTEGVPKTKMKGWKNRLTDEQRWQAIAYVHSFSHGGKPEVHQHPEMGK